MLSFALLGLKARVRFRVRPHGRLGRGHAHGQRSEERPRAIERGHGGLRGKELDEGDARGVRSCGLNSKSDYCNSTDDRKKANGNCQKSLIILKMVPSFLKCFHHTQSLGMMAVQWSHHP